MRAEARVAPTEQIERADAARNRRAILAAADALFTDASDPQSVSMDDIAREAGVGKGTLFRRFGDRSSLIREVYAARIATLREQIESGPRPLGPSAPPAERIAAVMDAIVRLKLANISLMAALEGSANGVGDSLFDSPNYKSVHQLLAHLLAQVKRTPHASWTAHLLLGAVRADLLYHLVRTEAMTSKHVRARVAAFVAETLASL